MVTSFTLLGASAIGIGSVCLYGLNTRSIGNWAGPLWRDFVRDRIRKTHIYLTLGLGVTATSALLAARSPMVLSLADYGLVPISFGTAILVFGSGGFTRSIPYENTALKFGSWLVHYAAMGSMLPVFCVFGGPDFLRFLIYMAGLMTGASAVGMCAPSKKFLLFAKPVSIIFGVVVAANVADMYMPRKVQFMPQGASAVGMCAPSKKFLLFAKPVSIIFGVVVAANVADMYMPRKVQFMPQDYADCSIYTGLVLFSFYCAFNGQRVIQAAEMIPQNGGGSRGAAFLDKYGQQAMVSSQSGNFDPINAQMSIFMDMANFLFRSFVF